MDLSSDLAPTGVLRAAINLGNPVLAQGTTDNPSGVTVDLARELARRLETPLHLSCFTAARESLEAMLTGHADLCFLAVEPAREASVVFTAPYALIEGVYAVGENSPLHIAADVDRLGVRVGVQTGSAYDLFLSRTLEQATVVRGGEGTEVFTTGQLEVAAGIRAPVEDFVAARGDLRVLEPRFMEIAQAIGTTRDRAPQTVAFLRSVVEELKASGFVADSLSRSGRRDAVVAPAAL